MKRVVELSMNVIIIAAIGMIVLVVLILLVANASRNVQDGTGCKAMNRGICEIIDSGESCSSVLGSEYSFGTRKDCPKGETCCWVPLGGGE